MEYNKLYRMKLLVIDDYQLATKKDVDKQFYFSRGGQFYQNSDMKEMGELIVQRKNKNTVTELATGIDIPLILLEISTNKHSDATLYSYELVGDTSSQALVFGITKTEGIPFQEDETFKLLEATEEEVAYYEECTKSAIWQETLVDIVEGAENRKREYQEEYKKGKKLHHQEMVRSLVKK